MHNPSQTRRLFHISEDDSIRTFIPRRSKAVWNFEAYVWAISETRLANYLLPRDCPRICVSREDFQIIRPWLPVDTSTDHLENLIFIPEKWKQEASKCVLYQYEFDPGNFTEIDNIAGYYVSRETEITLPPKKLVNCLDELKLQKALLVSLEDQEMLDVYQTVTTNARFFSIIRWKNFKNDKKFTNI